MISSDAAAKSAQHVSETTQKFQENVVKLAAAPLCKTKKQILSDKLPKNIHIKLPSTSINNVVFFHT